MLLVFYGTVFITFGGKNKTVGHILMKDPYFHLWKRLKKYQTLKKKGESSMLIKVTIL